MALLEAVEGQQSMIVGGNPVSRQLSADERYIVRFGGVSLARGRGTLRQFWTTRACRVAKSAGFVGPTTVPGLFPGRAKCSRTVPKRVMTKATVERKGVLL